MDLSIYRLLKIEVDTYILHGNMWKSLFMMQNEFNGTFLASIEKIELH